jgi:hypothetical protein
MKRVSYSFIVVAVCLFGSLLIDVAALAAPLGNTLPKFWSKANAPVPKWAKSHRKHAQDEPRAGEHAVTVQAEPAEQNKGRSDQLARKIRRERRYSKGNHQSNPPNGYPLVTM